MKLSSRSYPHPVVGNRDDVPAAAFQVTVEMSTDKENVYLEATVKCSSKTLNRLIEQGTAELALHVECSNTFYRRVFGFSEPNRRVTIPADDLNELVEVNCFVRAVRQISGYRVDGAHEDYGDAQFEIATGDILAVAEGVGFPIESQFDSLKQIGSLMIIEESRSDGDQPMQADFNGDKIVVFLSKADFREYKMLKSNESVSATLSTTIVLPVLMEALHLVQSGEYRDDGPRWVKALWKRLEELGFKGESDRLVVAQKILELPLKRSLASCRGVLEAESA